MSEFVSPERSPERYTKAARKSLEFALREALVFGHNYIGTEHILLGLVRENEGVAARILTEDLGVTEAQLRDRVLTHVPPVAQRAVQSDVNVDKLLVDKLLRDLARTVNALAGALEAKK